MNAMLNEALDLSNTNALHLVDKNTHKILSTHPNKKSASKALETTPNAVIIAQRSYVSPEEIKEMNAMLDEALDLSGLKKGALHKDLGIPPKENIPTKDLKISKEDSPLEKKRKQFAINAKKWHHENITTPLTNDSLTEAIQSVMEGQWEVHKQTDGKGAYKPTGTIETNKPFADKYYADRSVKTGHKYKLISKS